MTLLTLLHCSPCLITLLCMLHGILLYFRTKVEKAKNQSGINTNPLNTCIALLMMFVVLYCLQDL